MSENITNEWRVNTGQLFKEILINSEMREMRIPLNIFKGILISVGKRASELNDPKLNALMCRLSIYDISDPLCPEYDEKLTRKIIEEGK